MARIYPLTIGYTEALGPKENPPLLRQPSTSGPPQLMDIHMSLILPWPM